DHLATNGVLAYNVIGQIQGVRADLLGAIHRTLKSVFPEVYLFPAGDSQNVVLVATKSKLKYTSGMVEQRAAWLVQHRRVTLPTFAQRVRAFRADGPAPWSRAPVLADDYSPVEGLLRQVVD